MDGDRVIHYCAQWYVELEIFFTPSINLSASTNVIKLANKGYSEKAMQHLILMLNTFYCQR
jgi:hypothetical protein